MMTAANSVTQRVRRPVQRAVDAATRRVRGGRSDREISPFYGASYFGERGDGEAHAGYATYDRTTSNANIAAYLLWRFVPFANALDVGCAKGFLVEALCELGYDAYGCDISRFATDGAIPAIRPRLGVVDLQSEGSRCQLEGERYSLITLLEVLEHLRPEAVSDVLSFVRTIADGYVVATIPSFGVNRNGPAGFVNSKVRDDRLDHYRSLGDDYRGPVPDEDLMRDADGNPIEGHLTIASFDWWTEKFADVGFVRVDPAEVAMHPAIGRYNLSMAWNLYVFHVDSRAPAPPPERSELELAAIERRWRLDRLPMGVESRGWTRSTFGEAGAVAVDEEYAAERRRQDRFDALR
jgi:SAM-dependent methyltransferase